MKRVSKCGGLAVVLILLAAGCSSIKPAGSLGYALDGETRLRPIPTDYNHVPPRLEQRGPLQFQVGF